MCAEIIIRVPREYSNFIGLDIFGGFFFFFHV